MGRSPVSVVLPVYNAGNAVAEAIDRLKNTCGVQDQVLIVDDGSTDDTLASLEQAIDGWPTFELVRVFPNAGVAQARNIALKSAIHEYVWFVDWDDDWRGDILDVLVEKAVLTKADVVIAQARWRRADGLVLGTVERLPHRASINGQESVILALRGRLRGYLWNKLFRRSLLEEPMFPVMSSQSDFCGALPVLARANNIALVHDSVYFHVMRAGSITNSRSPRLENLDKCRKLARAVATGNLTEADATRWCRVYDYGNWHLAKLNTAIRLSDRTTTRNTLRSVLAEMRWSEILWLARDAPKLCLNSALVKMTGRIYPGVRASLLGVRDVGRHLSRWNAQRRYSSRTDRFGTAKEESSCR